MQTHIFLESAKLENNSNNYEVETKEFKYNIKATRVKVKTSKGENLLDKAKGTYDTIDCKDSYLFSDNIRYYVSSVISKSIKHLMHQKGIKTIKKVLVVGLGNKEITADSLGPKVTEKIIVTRHLKEVLKEKNLDIRLKTVSAIATGVLGTTGIETLDIIKAVADLIKPQAVIVIDTLATLNFSRLSQSFQLTNSGIVPGGGIGNNRKIINEENLKLPVIAIGVPFVMFASNIVNNVIEETAEKVNINFAKDKAKEMLGELIVTTKDIDVQVENFAHIIALAINKAINEDISLTQLSDYMN